jgi:hypothetical protein
VSAYLDKIIAGLTPKQVEAITATTTAKDGRVPHTVHSRTLDALYGKRLLRRVPNRRGGFDWFVLSYLGKRVAAALAERAANRPTRRKLTRPSRLLQYAYAAQLFAVLHPSAAEIVKAYQDNAVDTVAEGGPRFTPEDIWGQIGAEPGQRLGDNWANDPEEWGTPEGFITAWEHINRLAAAGKLTMTRWEELVQEARDVLAAASGRPAPVVIDKRPSSWQVLFAPDAQPAGERWADMPVVDVIRTTQYRAGREWHVVDDRLAARGLKRIGFPDAVSAGHALKLAQEWWQAQGPHACWFEFVANELPAVTATA